MVTIRERLYNEIYNYVYYGLNEMEVTASCEEIVEDVAVKFSEWVELNDIDRSGYDLKWEYNGKFIDTKELFELFKQQEGL